MFFSELALNIARELLAQWSVFILVHIGIHLAQLGIQQPSCISQRCLTCVMLINVLDVSKCYRSYGLSAQLAIHNLHHELHYLRRGD